jgi:hypothetical protein
MRSANLTRSLASVTVEVSTHTSDRRRVRNMKQVQPLVIPSDGAARTS